MNEQTEWWQMLTRLSPFLIPIASAMVALLIRDLLDPRQWQRLVRKTLASIGSGILAFAGMFSGYLALFWYVGNEDSPIISIAWIVVGLGIFPATLFASIFAFRSVEPNPDWYINSRFVHFFHNGFVANPFRRCATGMPSGKCNVHKWTYLCLERTYRRVSSADDNRIWKWQ